MYPLLNRKTKPHNWPHLLSADLADQFGEKWLVNEGHKTGRLIFHYTNENNELVNYHNLIEDALNFEFLCSKSRTCTSKHEFVQHAFNIKIYFLRKYHHSYQSSTNNPKHGYHWFWIPYLRRPNKRANQTIEIMKSQSTCKKRRLFQTSKILCQQLLANSIIGRVAHRPTIQEPSQQLTDKVSNCNQMNKS